MKGSTQRLAGIAVLTLIFGVPGLCRAEPKAIATVETNTKAIAELYECKRAQGVLTVKVRIKAPAKTHVELPYSGTYVVDPASGKRYGVLRDSGKAVATTSQGGSEWIAESLEAGATLNLWWKFPAPPATTKQISFVLPQSEPFKDVPITDGPRPAW